MRLTLRTLLAYLDDCLDPAETKLIGEKIQASPLAGDVVSRIKEVMRKRRLTSPDVSGPDLGIDPNLIAMYLDNTLPPEHVADIERVLLAKDELLAEAAACHQILTLLMSEVPEVTPRVRERLYALGPVSADDQLQAAMTTTNPDTLATTATGDLAKTSAGAHSPSKVGQATSVPSLPIPSATSAAPARDPLDSSTAARMSAVPASMAKSLPVAKPEVPEYLKQKGWGQAYLPGAMIALLVLICVGVVVVDPGFRAGVNQARTELKRKTNGTRADGVQVADGSGSSRTNVIGDSMPNGTSDPTSRSDTKTEGQESTESDVASVNVPRQLPPASKPELVKPDGQKPEMPADASNPTVAAIGERPVPDKTTEPKPAGGVAKPQVAGPMPSVVYASTEGLVYRLDEARKQWLLVPRRSEWKATEQFVVLEPVEASLDIGNGGMKVTILSELGGDQVRDPAREYFGGASVRLLPPSEAASLGIEVRRGRVLFQPGRRNTDRITSIVTTFGKETWKVELLTPNAVCALDVLPRDAQGFEKYEPVHPIQATFYFVGGTGRVTRQDGYFVDMPDKTGLQVLRDQGEPVSKPVAVVIAAAPTWTDPTKWKQGPLRSYSSNFERQFEIDVPAEQSLVSLIDDRNARMSELAVRGLSTIDSYQGMVKALAECNHEEGRFAARIGLHRWLVAGPERGELLKTELEGHYQSGIDIDAVYRLLWGFSREDGRDPKISQQLVDWLKHSRVEIRELADHSIERMTGKKTAFRATSVMTERDSAIRKLERQLEDAGGKLVTGE